MAFLGTRMFYCLSLLMFDIGTPLPFILSQEDLNAALLEAGDKLVVVVFSASWCLPCQAIMPHLEPMEQVYTDVVFLEVDVDAATALAVLYGISAMPTFKFFKNEQEVGEFVGADIVKLGEIIQGIIMEMK